MPGLSRRHTFRIGLQARTGFKSPARAFTPVLRKIQALLATLGLGAFTYGLIRAQGGHPGVLGIAALLGGVALMAGVRKALARVKGSDSEFGWVTL